MVSDTLGQVACCSLNGGVVKVLVEALSSGMHE